MATRYGVKGRKPGEQFLRLLLKPQPHMQLAITAKESFERRGFIDVVVCPTVSGRDRR